MPTVTPPNLAPVVTVVSLTAAVTPTTDPNGNAVLPLPTINTATAPLPPAAKSGDLVIVRANGAGVCLVTDPNRAGSPLVAYLAPGGLAVFIAQQSNAWQLVAEAPIIGAQAPGTGLGTLSLSSNNLPSGIATPVAPAGFLEVALPSGGVGLVPYWQ